MHKYHDCIVRFGFVVGAAYMTRSEMPPPSCSEPLYLLEVSEDVGSCWPNELLYVRVN
jgi:hypothetical protein